MSKTHSNAGRMKGIRPMPIKVSTVDVQPVLLADLDDVFPTNFRNEILDETDHQAVQEYWALVGVAR